MDDLKLITKSEEDLQKQIQTVKTFSDDIHMNFGLMLTMYKMHHPKADIYINIYQYRQQLYACE